MKMYFHADIGIDYILVQDWKPSTGEEMFLACLFTAALGILFESIKFVREYILKTQRKQHDRNYLPLLINYLHICQTFLHFIQYCISYCLMLIAMTFQIYLFLAVVIGCAIGYLFFTPLTTNLCTSRSFDDPCC